MRRGNRDLLKPGMEGGVEGGGGVGARLKMEKTYPVESRGNERTKCI